MGLCKAIQRHRAARAAEGGCVRPLRLVVMSATLEVQRFAAYFNAPAFFVCGRQHHVDTFYTVEPGDNYVHLAYHTVLQVHGGAEAGDVLVFMAGQEDILMLQDLLLQYQAAFQGEGREAACFPADGTPAGAAAPTAPRASRRPEAAWRR